MSSNYQTIFRNYRFVIGALTLLMFILLLRSSATSMAIPDIKSPTLGSTIGSQDTGTSVLVDPAANAVKNGKPSTSAESSSHLKTKCEEEKYVIMIDAGSTGSRVHIYKFNTCSAVPKLINETFEMLKPGLSSFDTDTVSAAKSLDPLLEKALAVIPSKLRGCSPVAVKATAGLRLLGEEKSNKIIAAVRKHLEKNYPFPVVEGDGVSIMSGAEEGVYAWITTNYLLGNIGLPEKRSTAAIFDLGGGSTQIVFEPSFKNGEELKSGEHKYVLEFGKYSYTLYQFSHLGYGLMQARDKLNALIVQEAIDSKSIKADDVTTVHNLYSPCLAANSKLSNVKVKLGAKEYTVNLQGPSSPAGPQCRYLAEKILLKDAKCEVSPCSFNSVYQPSLLHTLDSSSSLYVFSFFYERTYPLGLPFSYQLEEMTELARVACSDENTWKTTFSAIGGALESLNKEPNWCMDLSYQVALLHTGYDIPLHREMTTAKKIDGKEIGWCLGAALPLIMSDKWTCKVTDI